jgi:hypothetical protein
MKIAVGIVSILLSVPLLLQAAAAATATGLQGQSSSSATGSQAAIGVLCALLFIVGGAFSFAMPKVSICVFAGAGVFGILGAANGGRFADLYIWAVVAWVFAAAAYLAVRLDKRAKRKAQAGIPTVIEQSEKPPAMVP